VIRDALGPWAVSGPAIVAAVPALHDGAWRADARRRLERDAARLDGMLVEGGLRVAGGTPLFRLAVADDAARRFDRLGRAGILVRAFADHPTWLRFGIPGSRTAWDRVARVLQDMRS
jgi:cobalamin biosynthetic protein CobC